MSNITLIKLINTINLKEEKRCPFPTGIANVFFNRLESNIYKIINYVKKEKEENIKFLLPIKANAYGSGMIPVAKYLEQRKICTYYGVEYPVEAFWLKKNNIRTPILIMGQPQLKEKEIKFIINNRIEQSISNISLLSKMNEIAGTLNKKALIHLFIDTGMGRCGVLMKSVENIIYKIKNCSNVTLTGVMTHFPVSDSLKKKNINYTNEQIIKFKSVRKMVKNTFNDRDIIFHTSNSGGCLENRNSVFDMIRPGIASYGYPTHDMGLGLKPIMNIISRIVLIKLYPKNHPIGYGKTYKTKKNNERIAVVPIGHGDGLNRLLSNKYMSIINNQNKQSAGIISMDQCSVKVNKNDSIGDEVIIVGKRNEASNNALDIARKLRTVPGEVLCAIGNSSRIRHKYYYKEI